jgi:spermidine/putrescine transport system ATP-binding protein
VDSLSLDIALPLRSFRLELALEVGRETVALVGPSGAGKTTVLRAVSGLARPEQGSVRCGGETWFDAAAGVDLRPEERSVGYLFQDYALFPHMTVEENVRFAGGGADLLERFGISRLAHVRPVELSGGERQRAALARAVARGPKVLLLDEPLAALDLKLRHAMQAELKSIQREVGITFLFVTHDQDEALSMSDRVAIMNGGVIEQCGRPEDVYENPASIFAAGFIGTSNLMAGTYDGQGVAICPELRIPLVDGHGLTGGDQVSVAIRPEKIWLSELTPAMVQVPATVVSSSYHGATTQYLVEVATGVTLTVLEQNLPRMSVEGRWTPGSRVQLGWLPEHTVLLR